MKDKLFLGTMIITSPIWFPVGLLYSFGVMGYLIVNNEKIKNESARLTEEMRCRK